MAWADSDCTHTHTQREAAVRADYLRCEALQFSARRGTPPVKCVRAVRQRQWIQRHTISLHSEGESVRELLQWLDENERCLLRKYARQILLLKHWLRLTVAALRLFPFAFVTYGCFCSVFGLNWIEQRSRLIDGNADTPYSRSTWERVRREGARDLYIWRVRRTFPPIIKIRGRCDRKTQTHTCSGCLRGSWRFEEPENNIQNIHQKMHRVRAPTT